MHTYIVMDLVLNKFQDLFTRSVLIQLPIHGPIFPLQNLQRPILTNLLARMAITNNGKANLRSWYFCVHFKGALSRYLFMKARRCPRINRPFSKMAAENLNKSKLKTNTSTIKSILNLVILPRFRISGEISAEKMSVENCKIYRRLYDWGYALYPQS